MNLIFDLIQLVIQITLFGGVTFIVFNMVRSKKFKSAKTDIQYLQARLSQLRLALKAKVKRKSNVFRSMMKTAIVEGDLFDTSLKSLVEVNFNTGQDFQKYFETSKQLFNIASVDNKGTGLAEHTNENDYMSNDFKTEMDIIRIIKEMVDLNSKINHRVEEHNRTNTQKLERVESLMFPLITEVNRVFNVDASGAHIAAAPTATASSNTPKAS